MTIWLKQSTAADVVIGPFVDDTDGKTAETGLTISQADCQLSKNGGAVAQKNDATSASHLGGGHYKVPLNTTDTNTLGRLRLYVNEGGALPAWIDFMVVPANIWDSFFGADYLQVDAAQWLGQTIAAVDTNGYPKVTVKSGTGTGELSITSGVVSANAVQLSGDSVAADNAEAFFDGTGYAGTNNVMPTTTTVTNMVTANVTQLSGDSTAADNAEAFFDGTGYAGTNNVIPTVTTVNGLSSATIDAILDEVVEGSTTMRQMLRLLAAAVAGKSSGGGTATITFRDIGDTKDRIVATIDANRNRTAITLDGS